MPGRLDRLPWSRFHWRVVIGLGTVWILDGLEVTIVGSISGRIGEKGAGVGIAAANVSGLAGSLYVAGACVGALVFGLLTDRFGRKKLFMITLGTYLAATTLTAFSFAPLWFYVFRFFTGFGIGGEYAAINSAIDELIPSRNRGRVDIAINGSYWAGAAGGALLAVLALNESIFAVDIGWRLCFGLGAVLGLGVLIVRRSVPESPRWLFIHGREEEAERIVAGIEREVEESTGEKLAEPEGEMTVRQRRVIPLSLTVRSVVTLYPKRTVLGLALFIGQAFLYNSILFGLGDLLGTYFKVSSGNVPYYLAVFAVGNLFGPLVLGRLFDTVGRKPMIAGTYLLSGVLLIGVAVQGSRSHGDEPGGGAHGDLLLRVGWGQRRVPDRLGDLPDGDPGAVHLGVLRRGHGHRGDHRAAAVLSPDQDRQLLAGGAGSDHRRDHDDRGRIGRAGVRDPGRGPRARGHRPAVDRRRRERGRWGRPGVRARAGMSSEKGCHSAAAAQIREEQRQRCRSHS